MNFPFWNLNLIACWLCKRARVAVNISATQRIATGESAKRIFRSESFRPFFSRAHERQSHFLRLFMSTLSWLRSFAVEIQSFYARRLRTAVASPRRFANKMKKPEKIINQSMNIAAMFSGGRQTIFRDDLQKTFFSRPARRVFTLSTVAMIISGVKRVMRVVVKYSLKTRIFVA